MLTDLTEALPRRSHRGLEGELARQRTPPSSIVRSRRSETDTNGRLQSKRYKDYYMRRDWVGFRDIIPSYKCLSTLSEGCLGALRAVWPAQGGRGGLRLSVSGRAPTLRKHILGVCSPKSQRLCLGEATELSRERWRGNGPRRVE